MASDAKSRRSIRRIRGEGVRVRHSRSCTDPRGDRCPCGPSFEAFVYDNRNGKKIRKTFHTQHEARQWRIARLRRLYSELARGSKQGNLDAGYSHLRRAAQEFDRALSEVGPPTRAHVREALEALYQAEDAALRALTA